MLCTLHDGQDRASPGLRVLGTLHDGQDRAYPGLRVLGTLHDGQDRASPGCQATVAVYNNQQLTPHVQVSAPPGRLCNTPFKYHRV